MDAVHSRSAPSRRTVNVLCVDSSGSGGGVVGVGTIRVRDGFVKRAGRGEEIWRKGEFVEIRYAW